MEYCIAIIGVHNQRLYSVQRVTGLLGKGVYLSLKPLYREFLQRLLPFFCNLVYFTCPQNLIVDSPLGNLGNAPLAGRMTLDKILSIGCKSPWKPGTESATSYSNIITYTLRGYNSNILIADIIHIYQYELITILKNYCKNYVNYVSIKTIIPVFLRKDLY